MLGPAVHGTHGLSPKEHRATAARGQGQWPLGEFCQGNQQNGHPPPGMCAALSSRDNDKRDTWAVCVTPIGRTKYNYSIFRFKLIFTGNSILNTVSQSFGHLQGTVVGF